MFFLFHFCDLLATYLVQSARVELNEEAQADALITGLPAWDASDHITINYI